MSVQELRARTGAGIVACNNALKESGGDVEKAVVLLRQRGLDRAGGYTNRSATAGTIGSYTHHDGTLGVMVVLACETDFVARTDEFKQLANDIAMHVAASRPTSVSRAELPEALVTVERTLAVEEFQKKNMPPEKIERALPGKMEKFFEQHCLVDQTLVTDNKTKVGDAIKLLSSKCGEKIEVKKFVRLGTE